MSPPVDFHSQIASIMEVLANAAVAEICKVVDDGYAVVHLEMSRNQKENEFLRRKIKLLEVQVARYRAERLTGTEGSVISPFPGIRLLNRQNKDSLAGPSLQGKTRFQNQDSGFKQSVQISQHINLNQDPDQDVVTTTKTESAEPEEEVELLIVKVEGAMKTAGTNHKAPLDASIGIGEDTNTGTSVPFSLKNARTSRLASHCNETEVSGSDIVTFVVSRTPETDSCSSHKTGSDFTAEDGQPLYPDSKMTTLRDTLPVSLADVTDCRKDDKAMLDSFNSSEGIVIDRGGTSDKEGEEYEWTHVHSSNREASKGTDKHEHTSFPMIQCAKFQPAGHRSMPAVPCDDLRLSGGGTTSSINSSSDSLPSRVLHHPVSPSNHIQHKHLSSSFLQSFHHTVTMEHPYSCNSCTKHFFLESDLQNHMARHTREKPYTCLLCGKSFVCQSQLDIHCNIHTGERPFSCSICSRRFSHPSNLKRHQKTQH